MSLHLLLDSADPAQWREWLPSGLFRGVTCNPTLLRRAGQPCTIGNLAALSRQALALGAREVHLQAWGADAEALAHCGLALTATAPEQILVKLPVTRSGAEAARRLIAGGVPVTFTACYAVPQVLVAAALGARYIAPYLGRISDLGRDGCAELIAMQAALAGVGSSTRLLVASLRQGEDLGRLAGAGLDCFTLSPAIAEALFRCEETNAAARVFETDASAATGTGPGAIASAEPREA